MIIHKIKYPPYTSCNDNKVFMQLLLDHIYIYIYKSSPLKIINLLLLSWKPTILLFLIELKPVV
jgi:hypothetical protein